MNLLQVGGVALLMMPAVAGLHSLFYYNTLPARVASHFNGAGVADGFMEKGSFVAFYIGLVTFFALLFTGIATLISRLPTNLINLPNKEYWLAPERLATTLRALSNDMGWFGVLVCCLMISMMHLTFQANQYIKPQLPPLAMLLVFGFVIAEMVWLGRMVLRFSRTP